MQHDNGRKNLCIHVCVTGFDAVQWGKKRCVGRNNNKK